MDPLEKIAVDPFSCCRLYTNFYSRLIITFDFLEWQGKKGKK